MMKHVIFRVATLAAFLGGAPSSTDATQSSTIATKAATPSLTLTAGTPSEPDGIFEELASMCPPPKSCNMKGSNNNNYLTNDNGEKSKSESDTNTNINIIICSYENTLRGLATTRQNMQSKKTNNSFEVAMGLKMHLSYIQSEEASVGCALLQYHYYNHHIKHDETNLIEEALQRYVQGSMIDIGIGREEAGSICPKPKTCNFGVNHIGLQQKNGNRAAVEGNKTCDIHHLNQLQQSRDALEVSLFRQTKIALDQERMTMRLELAELDSEMAVVGCMLMMQHQVQLKMADIDNYGGISRTNHIVTKENGNQVKMNDPTTSSRKASPLAILVALFEQLQEDEEKFNHFLEQNYNQFTNSAEMESIVKGLEAKRSKRSRIQLVLDTAGQGDIPDIVWQERASREKAVEKLRGEERTARKRLLEMLHQRVYVGQVKISNLDTSKKHLSNDSDLVDDRSIWERIGERLDQEWEAKQRAEEDVRLKEEEQKIKDHKTSQIWNQEHNENSNSNGEDLHPPRPANISPLTPQECKDDADSHGTLTCTTSNPSSPSKSQIIMIDRMQKDMELLRRKAIEASSKEEKESRMSLVREMEKQLKLMM